MDIARRIVDFSARDLVDEDGRPVAEVASALYRDADTDLPACPYADGRAGRPMNRSALRQMTACWPELLRTIAGLGGGTVHGAWVAAARGVALPLSAGTPVPRVASCVFKASLGLSQVFSAMLLQDASVAARPLRSLGDGESFFLALDQGEWLHGDTQVCAGTKPMIVAIFDALADGAPPSLGIPEQAVALAAARVARRNELGLPIGEVPPWLRAVLAVPGRDPADVRRLFPEGQSPASLEGYLVAADEDAAFEAALRELGHPA